MKRFIYIFLFIGFIFLFITGCSDYNEINNVMIVDSIGIDKNNNTYLVSFNTYIGNNKYETYDVEVSDLDTSFNQIYLLVNKKIYLSHLNILYLSSNLNNADILDIINTFNNRDDLRGSFLVAMINNYDKDIFKSRNISTLLNNNYNESGYVYPVTFNEIISDYLDLSISYIPVIDNRDLSIKGSFSIFLEERFYNIEESSYLNILFNKSNTLSFDIDNSLVKLINIDTCYLVNRNNITINIKSLFVSNLDSKTIKSYLERNIYSFIKSNINTNYFISLIKKYDYLYYKDHDIKNINFDINIMLEKEEFNNTKGDDLIEKDS